MRGRAQVLWWFVLSPIVFAHAFVFVHAPFSSRAPTSFGAAAVWSFLAGALLVAAVVLALLDVGLPSLKGLVAQVAEAVRRLRERERGRRTRTRGRAAAGVVLSSTTQV